MCDNARASSWSALLSPLSSLIYERQLVDRRPLLSSLSVKARITQHALAAGVPSARTFYSGSSCAAAGLASLPPDYVLKATHTSGCVVVVRGGVVVAHKTCRGYDQSVVGEEASPALVRRLCEAWLAFGFQGRGGREWAYSAVPRGVLAEEVLPAPHSDAQAVAEDIKCWTAGGRTLFMHHTRSRFGHADKRDTFYDALTLRPRLDIRFGAGPFCGLGHLLGIPAALCLPHASRADTNASRWLNASVVSEAARACDRVAATTGIDFARIDLLLATPAPSRPRGLVLSEVTLYPFGGRPHLSPRSVDAALANAWCEAGGPYRSLLALPP